MASTLYIYFGDEIKENEMRRARNTCGETRNIYKIFVRIPQDHVGNLGVK